MDALELHFLSTVGIHIRHTDNIVFRNTFKSTEDVKEDTVDISDVDFTK